MNKIIFVCAALCLFMWSCNENKTTETSDQTQQTAQSPPTNAESSSLQPPYPIADSADFQEIKGMKIYLVEEGTGPLPKPGSNVVINYHGTLTDGTYFDGSFDKPGAVDFSLSRLIQGWQIGLTRIRTGSKVKLIVPPELGYGAQASGKIPPNSTLIFDIELLGTY